MPPSDQRAEPSHLTGELSTRARNELREFLRELIDVAAATTLPHFRQQIEVLTKSATCFDPVTIADRETEQALREKIALRFPEHGIIGEEGDDRNPRARYRWVIDPIDGTKAYICGIPTWGSLVGLCDRGKPVLGLMSQPFVGEYFLGGFGVAERVDRFGRVSVLQTNKGTDLARCSLFATAPDMFSAQQRRRFEALADRTQLTRFGVDSYAYCLLAAGYVDLVVEADLGFHDIAALIPMIETAGGLVTDWSGEPLRGGGCVVAAANETLHGAALAILNP